MLTLLRQKDYKSQHALQEVMFVCERVCVSAEVPVESEFYSFFWGTRFVFFLMGV